MKSHAASSRSGIGVVACALALAIAAVLAPAPTRAAEYLCKKCIEAGADTAATPGKTASGRDLLGHAVNPAVAFVDQNHRLRIALPSGNQGWQIEVVDSMVEAGGLALTNGAGGQPMISFHDQFGILRWAQRTATGIWLQQQVDPLGGVTGSTAIARWPGGVGIAYVGSAAGVLRYAESIDGGPWQINEVTVIGRAEAYPSLVVDGVVRAISSRDSRGDLQLSLRQSAGAWTSTIVDTAGDVGGYTSLIGGPSRSGFGIAYYDFTNADLKYATEATGGGWSIETVDGAGASVGRFASAVTFSGTANDLIGIAYYDQSEGDLKYALKRAGAWTVTVQDTAGDTGAYIACGASALPGDTIGIAYVERASGDLLYQLHAGSVAAVPIGSPAPLRLQWLRSAAGGKVRFTVPAAGRVRVAVYDAGGRVVAVPWRDGLPAGPAEVRWDGRDDRGRRVHTGVFFVRVETVGGVGAVPAVVTR